jgi:hypothetical protein
MEILAECRGHAIRTYTLPASGKRDGHTPPTLYYTLLHVLQVALVLITYNSNYYNHPCVSYSDYSHVIDYQLLMAFGIVDITFIMRRDLINTLILLIDMWIAKISITKCLLFWGHRRKTRFPRERYASICVILQPNYQSSIDSNKYIDG